MGRYTQLYIGKLYFAWKGVIPAYLAFPFGDEETYATPDSGDPDYIYFGYQTPCSLARERLDGHGFTLEFCHKVYEFFYNDLLEDLGYELESELSFSSKEEPRQSVLADTIAEYHNSHPPPSRAQQVVDFLDLVRAVVTGDPEQSYFSEPYVTHYESLLLNDKVSKEHLVIKGPTPALEFLGFERSWSDNISLDFEKLSDYLVNGYVRYPPWLAMLSFLFSRSNSYIHEYPEIVWLALMRLAVEVTDDDAPVRLELSDIVDDPEGARQIPTHLAQELINKLRLYNSTFAELFRDEASIRSRFMRSECARLLAKCDEEEASYDRGRALEDLVEMLFTDNGTLQVSSKRVSTDDEEIDLVIRNNIVRPFWQAFTSPLLFVECKNWTTRVGTSAIRDFEGKIRNHGKLVSLGFFVSLNGYTSQVASEMKRLGRDTYHIVLLQRADLEEYLASTQDFFNWLEAKVSAIY